MPSRRSRHWIWFFVVLGVLAVIGVTVPVAYNLSRQLKPEQLADARAKWNACRPRDYDLKYIKKGIVNGTFEVQVRGGKVVAATLDGRPLEERLFAAHDMNGLFDDIERFLEMDASPGSPRAFMVAQFDERDGRLLHFVRSAARQRIQIDVQLQPVTDQAVGKSGDKG